MSPKQILAVLACWLCLCVACPTTEQQVWAQAFDEKFSDWPVELKTNGRLLVIEELSNLGLAAKVVRADNDSANCLLLRHRGNSSQSLEAYAQLFGDVETFELDADNTLPTVDQVEVVAWHFDPVDRDAAESQDGLPQSALQRCLQIANFLKEQLALGKTVIVSGAGVDRLGAHYTGQCRGHSILADGYDLLPDCILQTSFQKGEQSRLLSAVVLQPSHVGIGLESRTLLLWEGRKVRAFGAGQVTFLLMANERLPVRTKSIRERQTSRQPIGEWLIDLTQWRREAIDRTLAEFPPPEIEIPIVENGALVIVGGGGMPPNLMEQFVALAGGPQSARLVYIPCAEEDTVSSEQSMLDTWKNMGVLHTALVHTKDRRQANADEVFLEPLKAATGIWFGGGRQWNLADSYYGTQAHGLMKQVLQRGGVIGGSSAGASIQARYLARATPIENFEIMAPGYERGGLGFIGGVAIDQHFTQRKRHRDMTQLVDRYPQLLGIGIDETTAIIVQQSRADVVGRGQVHFYDRTQPVVPGLPDFTALRAGEAYDLAARKVLSSSTP